MTKQQHSAEITKMTGCNRHLVYNGSKLYNVKIQETWIQVHLKVPKLRQCYTSGLYGRLNNIWKCAGSTICCERLATACISWHYLEIRAPSKSQRYFNNFMGKKLPVKMQYMYYCIWQWFWGHHRHVSLVCKILYTYVISLCNQIHS